MARQGLRVPYSDERFLEMLDQVDKKTLYPDASHEEHGLMSVTDKEKLDGIEAGAEPNAPNTVIDADYVHTDNNYTNEDKAKLAGIESGAQANVIEKIRVNAVPQTVTDKGVNIEVPAKTSELVNDAGFVAYTTRALANYYLKSEVYTKSEVASLIAAVQGISVRVVDVLPTASAETMRAIYLVPSVEPQAGNTKDEWITVEDNGAYRWEQIGSTAINLDGYVTDEELTAALQGYVTSAAFATALAGKQDVIGDLSEIRAGAQAGASAYQKPSGGIPAADLSEAVQASLEKADNPPTEIFWATYGETTAAEIDAAVAAGKAVMCKDNFAANNSHIFTLCQYNSEATLLYFSCAEYSVIYYLALFRSTGTWLKSRVFLQDTANMAQTISGNESATNKYPSTKAVADYVTEKAEVFVAEYGVTTYADVVAADTAGKTIFVKKSDGRYYVRVSYGQVEYVFGCTYYNDVFEVIKVDNTGWSQVASYRAEQTSNRVSSWRSTPDNTHYPSEKLVKDSLDAKQDTISDLASIRSGAAKGETALQSFTESDPTVPAWAKAASKPSYSYSEITGKPTLAAVATSGSYGDLSDKPTIPTVPAISTDIAADKTSTTKTAAPSAVYSEVHPATASSQPAGGMLPNVLYKLGTLTGNVTISLAAATDANIENEYKFTFTAGSTAPTITWPASITMWAGNCVEDGVPTITGGNYYEVSVEDGVAFIVEVEA